MLIRNVGQHLVRRVLSRLGKKLVNPASMGMQNDAVGASAMQPSSKTESLGQQSEVHPEASGTVASASEEVRKDIEIAARNGRVIDAHAWKLHSINLDQVGELASIIAAEEQALAHEMERLEAMFPVPIPVIEPKPEEPKRAKHFPRLGNLAGGRRPNGLH